MGYGGCKERCVRDGEELESDLELIGAVDLGSDCNHLGVRISPLGSVF